MTQTTLLLLVINFRVLLFTGNGTVVLDNSAACPPPHNCSQSVEMRKMNGDALAYILYFCSSALDIVSCAEEIVSRKNTFLEK